MDLKQLLDAAKAHGYDLVKREADLSQSPITRTDHPNERAIWRLPIVVEQTGMSRSAIYQDASRGLFTQPVKLGMRAAGWPSHEVRAINRAKIAGASAGELQKLVARLMAERRSENA